MSSLDEIFDDANGDLAIGELESAIEKYRRCVELDPTFFDGWHALGMALMKVGRFPEAIEAGCAHLAGTTRHAIVADVERLWDDEAAYRRMQRAGNPFGDGLASHRIVTTLERHLQAASAGKVCARAAVDVIMARANVPRTQPGLRMRRS